MSNVKLRLIALYDSTGADRSNQFGDFTIEAVDPDEGFLTFASARAGGGDDWIMKATIPQDRAAGSVWREVFDNPGDQWTGYFSDDVDVDLETEVTAATPVYEFTAIISRPRGSAMFGGAATKAVNAVATTAIEWKLTGQPTEHTADLVFP